MHVHIYIYLWTLQCVHNDTIKIQRASHGVLIGFQWQDLPQPSIEPEQPEPPTDGAAERAAEPAAEPSEPAGGDAVEMPRKRAKAGQGPAGPSFARRTCPKTCPAKQRWMAIKGIFEEVIEPRLSLLGFRKTSFEARVKIGVGVGVGQGDFSKVLLISFVFWGLHR